MNIEQPKEQSEEQLTKEEILDLARERGITFVEKQTPEEIKHFNEELGLGREQFIEALKFALKEESLIFGNSSNKEIKPAIEYAEEYFANETKDNIAVFLPRRAESVGIARHGVKRFFYEGRKLSDEEEIEKDNLLLALCELVQNVFRHGREGSEYFALSFSKEDSKAKEISIMNFANKGKEIPSETIDLFDSCSGLSENEAEEKIGNDFKKEDEDFLNGINTDFENHRGLKLVCAFCEVDFKRTESERGDICYKFTLRHRPEDKK